MSVPQAEPADRIAPHRPLVSGAGLVDLPKRTQVELLGADRASFLHNLCTNEIRKLAAGQGMRGVYHDGAREDADARLDLRRSRIACN